VGWKAKKGRNEFIEDIKKVRRRAFWKVSFLGFFSVKKIDSIKAGPG
jgi:hypothetical protein